LTVRDVERLVKAQAPLEKNAKVKVEAIDDANTKALERLLSDLLGLNVKISHRGEAGDLRVQYKSLDQLDLLCKKLQG
ncbi:MAG TPA: hypothetical protein VIJ25_03215, partial [Methylococcales bacterium]